MTSIYQKLINTAPATRAVSLPAITSPSRLLLPPSCSWKSEMHPSLQLVELDDDNCPSWLELDSCHFLPPFPLIRTQDSGGLETLFGQESPHSSHHIPVIQLTHLGGENPTTTVFPSFHQHLISSYRNNPSKTIPERQLHRGVHRIIPHDAKCLLFPSRVSIEKIGKLS